MCIDLWPSRINFKFVLIFFLLFRLAPFYKYAETYANKNKLTLMCVSTDYLRMIMGFKGELILNPWNKESFLNVNRKNRTLLLVNFLYSFHFTEPFYD